MLPSGEPTESIILFLKDELTSGDTVLDGGNANYKESIRRYELLAKDGIHFLDVGISGGIWGLDHGYSLMVGGDKSSFTHNTVPYTRYRIQLRRKTRIWPFCQNDS